MSTPTHPPATTTQPMAPPPDAGLVARLEQARQALLDLSTRNRLLSLPRHGRSRGVLPLEEEDPGFVLEALRAGRAFGFEAVAAADAAPGSAPPSGRRRGTRTRAREAGIAQADGEASLEERRRDSRLRVALPLDDAARRLRDLMHDARTAREETGISTLSLAIGALVWRDPATPGTERIAPLALFPVALERDGVSQSFRLRAAPGAEDGPSDNLSLREKLAREFGLPLPEFDPDAYEPAAWAAAVAAAIGTREGWRVEPDALAIGLFSFAKFLLWRDLDPEANPGLLDHPLIRSLVGGEALPPQPAFADDTDVDAEIPVERLDHVVEVDGSQALAAEAVRRGGHVVIQGPPGTGKSQTIVNIIAQAVLDGRTVLFVAEKLAALEVVKRRLDGVGIGAACLELHSEKQSRRAVLDELRATLGLPTQPQPDREAAIRRLGALRGRLNRHAAAMRSPAGASGLPLHEVVGKLVALRTRGVPAPDFTLSVGGWDAARIATAKALAEDLAARAAEGGPKSPWRGVGNDLTASGQDRLMARLSGWIRSFAAAGAALAPAAEALGRPAPGPSGAAELLVLARAAAALPADCDRGALADPAWQADPSPLRALAEAAATLAAARTDSRLAPGALDASGLAEARATLAEGSGGFFGFLSSARRRADAVLAQVARDPAADPLGTLDAALAGQRAREALRAGDALGRAAFGRLWRGEHSDAQALAALVAWREAHGPGAAAALAGDGAAFAVAEAPVHAALEAWEELRAATALDPRAAFGAEDPPFAALAARLGEWAAQPEALPLWLGWRRAATAAAERGLGPLAERLADGRLAPEAAADAFAYALHEALFNAAMAERPELAAFDAAAQDRLVQEFREADRARIALARAECAWAHAQAVARVRQGVPGTMLLRGEMEKKRGHLPLRELLLRAGPAIQAAKPVFMMSPLSVAQFLAPPHSLKPGLTFDLLVMDEASQIEPVDALGAIARCRQVAVVGDDRQMPPTRFFQRMTGEDEPQDEEETGTVAAARDIESILGLANARGVPNAMLRWHYRSRHESLIATSNFEFYEGRLVVPPSPHPRSAMLGLTMVRVDGRWESGSGVNRAEAEAIAEAVIRHARETPDESLGVAAFSVSQRDAILDAIEQARRANPDTEPFFAAHPLEPFFVKNLENVQGDERDAMLISVGYGRDAEGRFAMRFGPLGAEGGERRLNVLITRARRRCAVFASIGAEDIDLSRAQGRGVAALKAFLAYAAGGTRIPARQARQPVADSAALIDVISSEIQAAGMAPEPRVGTSGLFVDVAARGAAPEDDAGDGVGDCLLGVEADTADWAALRACRDREGGRTGVLTMMGWRLHRAWSLGWLQRPDAERMRLRQALGITAAAPAEEPGAGRGAMPDPGLAEPYREAKVERPAGASAIPDTPFATLAEMLASIIRQEAPVHTDAVLERARLAWGLDGLTSADRAALLQGLRLARQLLDVREADGFWMAGTDEAAASEVVPRDRRAAAPHLRRAALLPPLEVEAAAHRLLALRPHTTEGELAAGITRLLGLDPSAEAAVAARLAALVGAGSLRLASGPDRVS